jgi:glycosyltransferase 2 family protein
MAEEQRLVGLTPGASRRSGLARAGRIIGFSLGIAVLAAIMVRVGAGSVARSLERLGLVGLLALVLIHLPVVAAMAGAWRSVAVDVAGGSRLKFVWARLVRDGAAEALPFSQLGGFVLGLHALNLRGAEAVRGAISMGVDLVIELAAKLPYLIAGVLLLFAFAPRSDVLRPILLGLVLTAAAVSVPVLARRRIWRLLESASRAILSRWASGTFVDPANRRAELEEMLEDSLRRRTRVLAGFLLHLVSWFVGAAELWVLFALLGARVGALQALAIDSIVVGFRSFAFMIPAAAGVQEASFVFASAAFGVPPTIAVAASLARRARDLVLGGTTLAIYAAVRTLCASRQRTLSASR